MQESRQNPSRRVSSNQVGLHARLAETVHRHLQFRSRRPVSEHAREAFALLQRRMDTCARPLVLDSYCGTGESSARLALRHPHHLVIGVDQSAHRLSRHKPVDLPNYILLRAPAEDLWQMLATAGRTLDFHYILYPNPWPKSKHLKRRVHGHPGFAWLIQLGGTVELRSNWQLYVEEFGTAMSLCGHTGAVARFAPDAPITAFERKYLHSDHCLWRYRGAVTNHG